MSMIRARVELPTTNDSIDVAGLRAALAKQIAGEARFDRLSRALYSTDASVYQIVPLGVVIPRDEADILATVDICSRFRVPITARGGGTSQAGQAIGAGIQLDCSKYFNRILEVNAAARWVRVQPGCVLDDLNREVKNHGLQFAPDVSTSNRATIGGMIANNSSGSHSVIYGKTVDYVVELRTVLADGHVLDMGPMNVADFTAKGERADRDGVCYRAVQRLAADHAEEIDRRFPKILRRVGGYNLDLFSPRREEQTRNLAHLFVGSEGTLGITLDTKLRLVDLPRAKALLVVQFGELLEALAATPAILTHGPAAIEVIDKYVLDSTRLNPEATRLRDFLRGDPGAILIIEFFGDDAASLVPRLNALEAELRQRRFGYDWQRATEPEAQAKIWKLRKAALGLSMAQKGDAKALSFVEDTAVAPERLRDYIADFLAAVARHGTTAGVYAHASVGCLHVRPIVNLKTIEGVCQFEAIAEEVAGLVLHYGGSLSGEHGDGLVRSPFQEKMYGPVLYQAFRELKRNFDPQNLLNPGKVVDAPALTENLRFGPCYVTPDVTTTFDFAADGGLTRAAELCAGVGACRKTRDGTMCPSYQATRDEQHSTRGRANALRLAITGQLGFNGFTDPMLTQALDLCLECKACKSECPTNVDMARLKAEFLHQYFKKHGVPWRNHVFGNVARWNEKARAARWAFNAWTRSGLGRWLNERLLGIDARRLPPPLARENYWDLCQPAASPSEKQLSERPKALLFPDTFIRFYEPRLARSACRVLRHIGCDVAVGRDRPVRVATDEPSDLHCCGRTYISNGMLDQSVKLARHNVARLLPWAESGYLIFACEPSCILTIKDDYPALLRGSERQQAEIVAAACRTFEEVAEMALAESDRPTWQPLAKPILVQSHCHQRSLVGMEPTLLLFRRIPEANVIDLEAGCCGLAGSFGYEKEHYEVSRLVGEQRLFPALREAKSDTIIVASGFSCRKQIEHFTGRRAIHPAELLENLVDERVAP